MKLTACLVICLLGYAYANTCTGPNTCDTSVTTCADGYTLTCMTLSNGEMHCVCVGDNNAHTCTTENDCHNQNLHHCNHGHWACTGGHCHCTGGGNNNPGGNPGGK